MGDPCPPPPPFRTEQALNAEVYRALRACSYSDTAHISIWITVSCPANIKHSNLQLRRTVLWQCLTYKGWFQREEGSEKRPYDESPRLQSSCHKFCVVMVVSDGFRSTLIWSKFKNFPGGACPQTPLERCALYVIFNSIKFSSSKF